MEIIDKKEIVISLTQEEVGRMIVDRLVEEKIVGANDTVNVTFDAEMSAPGTFGRITTTIKTKTEEKRK